MGTSAAAHAGFFRQAFDRLAAKPARILVAGGADYSMLAHAAAACRARGLSAEFTMIDWCETPLMLSRWYAQRESIVLQTVRRDLLEPGIEAQFDAICTHALLGHFAPERRAQLISGLARALRPGGLLFLPNRLRPGAADAPAGFAPAQVEEFAATVVRAAHARGVLPGVDAVALAAAARAYAARQVSWPVRSREEVEALFESQDLHIEHLSCAPLGPAAGAALDVPTIAGGADYAHIIAVRR